MSNGSPGLANDNALPMIIFRFACRIDVIRWYDFCLDTLLLFLLGSKSTKLPLFSFNVLKATGIMESFIASFTALGTALYAATISSTFSASEDGVTTSVENNNLSNGIPSCCLDLLYGSSSHLNWCGKPKEMTSPGRISLRPVLIIVFKLKLWLVRV